MLEPAALGTKEASRAWRGEIAARRAALRADYLQTGSAPASLAAHCALIDEQLETAWQQLGMPDSIALLAVGGYGRRELFPYSDVDVLVLLRDQADTGLQRKLEALIGLLWDLSIDVGHSVRTVAECLEQARADVTVLTNLLEARLITGSKSLFADFFRTIARAVNPRDFYAAKLSEQQTRHWRYQDSAYSLEPNIKESPGGLRDLQTILWISRTAGLGESWRELVGEKLITSDEERQLRRDVLLLQNLRIRLHYLANRREDRLLFDYQAALAEQFGLRGSTTRLASEQLMQRYYRAAKSVSQLNAVVLQNLRTRIFPPDYGDAQPIDARFQSRNGLLEARDLELFEREPHAILESFLLLQRRAELEGMSAATLRSLWRARRKIDGRFRRDPHNRALFMEILRQPRGVTHELRRMHQYGILGRYLPVFGRIIGQMQHDLFHVYTVDEHILKVVRNLRRFALPRFAHEFPLASRLFSEFERPEVLYLAALFHDIAKGRGGDHSKLGAADAQRFCRAHDLSPPDTSLIVWLVENHLVMSATAQKRDLSDPDVISRFAGKVGDDRHLVALYLLTVADIRGTSPKVWNAWKARLLEHLFWATRRRLTGTVATVDSEIASRQHEALAKLKLYALRDNAHEMLWREFDTDYFARHEAQEIAWHTRSLHYRVNAGKPVVKARLSPIGEGLQVMIFAPDREKLFARICSFFESMHYNIVQAKIYTTRHRYALDSFQVLDPANKSAHYRDLIAYIEHELGQRLQSDAPLPPLTRPRLSRQVRHFPMVPEVSIQTDEKHGYQTLALVAADRPGLLSRIARTLAEHQIDVHAARINTLGERAEDVFVVSGKNLEDVERVAQLSKELLLYLQA